MSREIPQPVIEVTGPISVPVVNKDGQPVGTVELDPNDFSKGGKINRALLHEVALMYLANQRAGTHHTLRRGQVAGSTKKLFRQKGTGNARAGTKRTNKRVGGGTAKGPKPRDYEYHLPKKAVRAATRMAVLSKFADREAVIVEDFGLTAPKTKQMSQILKSIAVADRPLIETSVLIGTAGRDEVVYKSARNIEGVEILPTIDFNAYTVLKQRRLVLTKAAFEALRKPQPKPQPQPEPEKSLIEKFPKKKRWLRAKVKAALAAK